MKRRVLVVDDEANIRRVIRLTLESDGYDVEDAQDGQTALEMFGDGSRFDAVVLDQRMPGMDGLETLRHIRKRAPSTAVVMVTAYGSIELAVDAMKAGATDFLKKPLTPDLLRGALLAAMSKNAPRKPAAIETAAPSPADVWTVNGFFIRGIPSGDIDVLNQHRFLVRHASQGPQGEVIVVINDREISRISRLSGHKLPPGKRFWQQQAERALMNHLFREAALPPDNRLVVDRLSDEVVLLAKDWTGTGPGGTR
jgi:CheY-like chemotaxis protein